MRKEKSLISPMKKIMVNRACFELFLRGYFGEGVVISSTISFFSLMLIKHIHDNGIV